MTHETLVEDAGLLVLVGFDTADVVWALGLQVLHQLGHRALELRTGRRRTTQRLTHRVTCPITSPHIL